MSKYIDEKTKRLLIGLGAVVGLIVIIIIVILIINSIKGTAISYTEIEDKMVEAAQKYYSSKSELLPMNDKDEVEVSTSALVEAGYMKELSKYQEDKNVSCSGTVIVTRAGAYYNYSPKLDCGDTYSTTYLNDKLLETVVSKDDGLYKTSEYTKKGNKTVYVYKGDYVNNYIKIDNIIFRIVKIDSDGDFMLIENSFDKKIDYRGAWDNRYNTEKKGNYGIGEYYKSIIRKKINEDVYGALSDNLKAKLVLKEICIGSRKQEETKKDGSVECRSTLGVDYLSLLTAYDFMNASLDVNCKTVIDRSCGNYNYLNKFDRPYWLLNTDAENTYSGYVADKYVSNVRLSSSGAARIVLSVTKNLIFMGGSGTSTDPYLIK